MSGRRRELILYATPLGPLAEAIDAYFHRVAAELGPTVAQTYPPHCSLTGFFRRDDRGAGQAIEQIGSRVDGAGPVPAGAVEVVGLTTSDRWVGLELRSPWLIDLTAAVAEEHRPGPGDDALRPKDWLHLSLAYGHPGGDQIDLGAHGRLATEMVDPTAAARWEVAVWERHPNGSWHRHGSSGGRRTAR